MESDTNTDVDKLITFGQMALEQGWHDKARDHFEQALELDADNELAKQAIAKIDEMLRPKPPFKLTTAEETPAEPESSGRSILGWIREKRKERADRIADRMRLEAEKREVQATEYHRQRGTSEEDGMGETDLPESEEARETDLSGRWDLELPPMDLLIELLRFQCQQLERIEVELLKQRGILDKQTEHLNNISMMAALVMLLIVIGGVLTMCSGFSSPSLY